MESKRRGVAGSDDWGEGASEWLVLEGDGKEIWGAVVGVEEKTKFWRWEGGTNGGTNRASTFASEVWAIVLRVSLFVAFPGSGPVGESSVDPGDGSLCVRWRGGSCIGACFGLFSLGDWRGHDVCGSGVASSASTSRRESTSKLPPSQAANSASIIAPPTYIVVAALSLVSSPLAMGGVGAIIAVVFTRVAFESDCDASC